LLQATPNRKRTEVQEGTISLGNVKPAISVMFIEPLHLKAYQVKKMAEFSGNRWEQASPKQGRILSFQWKVPRVALRAPQQRKLKLLYKLKHYKASHQIHFHTVQ